MITVIANPGYLSSIEKASISEKGTVYPTNPVELPQSLILSKNPSYLTRGFWAWWPQNTGVLYSSQF